MLQSGGTRRKCSSFNQTEPAGSLQQVSSAMDQLSGYAHHPFRFVLRYLRQRPASHLVILTCVVAAVACSVSTQYGVKFLVDCLSAGPAHAEYVWLAFAFLISLIAAIVAMHGGNTFQTNMFSTVKIAFEVAVIRLVSMPGRRSEK